MIVEIDGDTWHTETPAQAHTRLQFLLDEGAHLHRISASDCDTIDKAREAAKAVIARISKLKSSQ